MIRLLNMMLLATLAVYGESFNDFKTSQEQGVQTQQSVFEAHLKAQQEAYRKYQEETQRVYDAYSKKLSRYWEDPKLSSKTEWVAYTPDAKSRSSVDFENEVLKVETIAHNKDEALLKLEALLSKTVSADTQKAFRDDPLQQELNKVTSKEVMTLQSIPSQPILSNALFENKPTKAMLNAYVTKQLQQHHVSEALLPQHQNEKLYTLEIKLPSTLMQKRSQAYAKEVFHFAQTYQLPPSLIFAIMQTESAFNPFARSHIPAYGLMQIVPTSAGIDAYNFVYKKKAVPGASYLYNAHNNIELGSAYLHLLYFNYLRLITNKKSRLYCSIAAYNTGAGNVARAFGGTNSVANAAKIINTMSSNEVYEHLKSHLKYEEARNYIVRVRERMPGYFKMYYP